MRPGIDPLAAPVDDRRALRQFERDARARELDPVARNHDCRAVLDSLGAGLPRVDYRRQ